VSLFYANRFITDEGVRVTVEPPITFHDSVTDGATANAGANVTVLVQVEAPALIVHVTEPLWNPTPRLLASQATVIEFDPMVMNWRPQVFVN